MFLGSGRLSPLGSLKLTMVSVLSAIGISATPAVSQAEDAVFARSAN